MYAYNTPPTQLLEVLRISKKEVNHKVRASPLLEEKILCNETIAPYTQDDKSELHIH